MHLSKKTDDATPKDIELQILNALHGADPGSAEFAEMMKNYKELKEIQVNARNSRKLLTTLLPIFGNIGGIGLIGLFEARGYIFTSKAFPLFASKLTGRP